MARATEDEIRLDYDQPLSDIPSVYYGVHPDRDQISEVAVKKIRRKGDVKKIEKEIRDIIKLEKHENAVQYFRYKFSSQHDIYISMTLCRKISLHDIVRNDGGYVLAPTTSKLSHENMRKILLHIALGISHVHKNAMTFLTLRPKCILLAKDGESIKITGFGISKWGEKSSSTSKRNEIWGSPEYYSSDVKTFKSDIFSAGQIFHYVVSEGKHPFGERYTKENIQDGKHSIDVSKHRYPLIAIHLIKQMVSAKPDDRPSADEILLHPLLWEEDKKKNCVEFLLQLWEKILPKEKREILKVRADLESVIKNDDHLKKLDAILLLYCSLVSKVPPDAACEGYFMEAAARNGKNLKEVLQSFNQPVKYSKLDASEFAEDKKYDIPDLSQLTIAGGETSDVASVPVAYDNLDINPQPLRKGSFVFVAKDNSVVLGQMKIVKFLRLSAYGINNAEEIFQKFNSLEDPGIMKVEVQDHQWPANKPDPPFSGEKCLRIVMKDCLQKTLIELAQCEGFSSEDRKIASVQILYALHELHGSGIVHGNISPRKFCMSKEGTRVQMLASRDMRLSSHEDLRVADLRSTAKALCVLMCCDERTSIKNNWEWEELNDTGDMHRLCESSLCSDGAVFYDLLDQLWKGKSAEDTLFHPFFWSADERLNFWCKFSDDCDSRRPKSAKDEVDERLKELAPENWIERLKLDEDEKAAWFDEDPDGYIYNKANAENSAYRKNPSKKSLLLRLIRNVSGHIVEDIDKYKVKHKLNPDAKQSLFQNRADVWKFFDRRFDGLFHGTYTYVREEAEVRERLKEHFTARATNKSFPKKKRTDFEIRLKNHFADPKLRKN